MRLQHSFATIAEELLSGSSRHKRLTMPPRQALPNHLMQDVHRAAPRKHCWTARRSFLCAACSTCQDSEPFIWLCVTCCKCWPGQQGMG